MKSPETIRRAVIDVGTNSIKLLVADITGGAVQPVLEDSEQTRLGAGFFETNRLQAKAIEQTARAVATFAAKAKELGAISTRVIATSAAREATNAGDLTSAIEGAASLKVEIITGEQEADYAFRGVNTDPELARQRLLLLDVGGGSTEFIVGEGGSAEFRKSFPLGTVRVMEKLPYDDPPAKAQLAACQKFVRDFLTREIRPQLASALKKGAAQLVGTGGTATILGRMEMQLNEYDRSKIEGARLSIGQIRAHVNRLWSMPLAERKTIVGLPKSRADVILPGVVIYEGVMETLGFSELRISTRGLRFAAVM